MAKKTEAAAKQPSPFKSILPESVRVGQDTLQLRIDFYSESIVMQDLLKNGGQYRFVSAHDIAKTLASQLPTSSGLLPLNSLWWANTKSGPLVALWVEPGMRWLALETHPTKPPQRFNIPLPGLIFICRPGRPPHVYAAGKRPEGPRAQVFKAPLTNVYEDGRSCPGTNNYPVNLGEVPDSFLRSFFTAEVNLGNRSKKHPDDITKMWGELDKKKAQTYPLTDLVYHGMVSDLMAMRI